MTAFPRGRRDKASSEPDANSHSDLRIANSRSLRRWVTAGIVLLVAALGLSAIGTFAEGRVLNSIKHQSRTVLRPAQVTTAELLSSYIDQETGVRGFLLTGKALYLAPYKVGRRDAASQQATLANLKIEDPSARRELANVIAAGTAWETQIAQPQIALRRSGPLTQQQVNTLAFAGKQKFDALRNRLTDLSGRLGALIAAEQQRNDRAQSISEATTLSALSLALLIAAVSMFSLHRLLSRPLTRLVADVQEVAEGDFDRPIGSSGATEIALIAAAAEAMRQKLIEHSADLSEARRALTLTEERDRIASDLHRTTIKQVYALGLTLQSMSARDPAHATELNGLVDDTDAIIRELRGVVFDAIPEQPAKADGSQDPRRDSSPSAT